MVPKKYIIQKVINAAMHILHNSFLNGSDLWPKDGVKVGWHTPPDQTVIYVNARMDIKIDPDKGLLIINANGSSENYMQRLFDGLLIILEDAIYDEVKFDRNFGYEPFQWVREHSLHIQFRFTIQ